MKKILALVIASGALLSGFGATPVFACPNSDHDKTETAAAPKKADDGTTAKAKDTKAPATQGTDKAADKNKPSTPPKAAAKG
jgi:hypothetical protein